MTDEIKQAVESVKRAKATNLFLHDVKAYGSIGNALRALDCRNMEEAVNMLMLVQKVSIFKRDGKVIVQ